MNKERVELPDDLNPEFLFSLTHSALLVDIAKERIDPVALAKKALANRGIDTACSQISQMCSKFPTWCG